MKKESEFNIKRARNVFVIVGFLALGLYVFQLAIPNPNPIIQTIEEAKLLTWFLVCWGINMVLAAIQKASGI